MSLQEIADQVVRGKLRFSPQQVRVLIELLPFHMPKLGDSPRSPDRRGLIEARVEDDDDESPNK
ncbi:MAG: hypothetical protein WB689_13140 [Xanthobacteraceae bacterium]